MPLDRRSLMGVLLGAGAATGLGSARAAGVRRPAAHPGPAHPGPAHPAPAHDPAWPPREWFPLWPGTPPGAPARLPSPSIERNGFQGKEQWLRGAAQAIVGVFRPAQPDGRAVLAIPGGGYTFVSVSNEGVDVAGVLNPRGITVFVLAYRIPGDGWFNRADVPLQDAQRAMRLIRHHAAKWHIDAERLAAIGFSAGGHLAAMLGVGHDDPVYSPLDAADMRSARPAHVGLVYATVSMVSAGFEARAENGLWGRNADADPAVIRRYTPLDRVTAAMPPVFLVHAFDDGTVPVRQGIEMTARCHAHKVPVEAHLFEHGGHGFGALHVPERSPAREWPELYARWSATH